jgi:hypothetical protein
MVTKYSLKKFFAKRKLKAKGKPEMDEYAEKHVDVIYEMIKNPKVQLQYTPSGERAIIDSEKDISVFILGSSSILIINTVYQYNLMLSEKEIGYIIIAFNDHLERRFHRNKSRAISKVKKSLDNILLDVKK